MGLIVRKRFTSVILFVLRLPLGTGHVYCDYGWVGGWMGGCGYLPLKNFRCEKLSFENILLFRCLELLGGTLFKFFGASKSF